MPAQPGSCESPVRFDDCIRDLQRDGDLADRHAAEVAKLHDLCLSRMRPGQPLEGLVQVLDSRNTKKICRICLAEFPELSHINEVNESSMPKPTGIGWPDIAKSERNAQSRSTNQYIGS
jgi:hypothetical protein